MPMRDEITRLAIANWWAEPDPYTPTVDDTLHIFEGADRKPVSTRQEIESCFKQENGMKIGGQTKHWCGIFAVSALKSAGLDIRWTLVKDEMVGPVGQVEFESGKNGIQPDDIAIIHTGEHHFIITDVQIEGNVIRSVDGNTSRQKIRWTRKKFSHDQNKAVAQHIYGCYQVLV